MDNLTTQSMGLKTGKTYAAQALSIEHLTKKHNTSVTLAVG
jgi:hypothetical protein